MSKQILWNKLVLEEFIDLASLTEDEEHIIRLRVAGYTNEQIALKLGLSRSTVNRYTKRLKQKYDNVEKYSALLPPRKKNAKELFADEQ